VALRWTLYHSLLSGEYNDGVIVGCSSLQQMEQNLTYIDQGPLPKHLVEEMEMVWQSVKGVGPSYHK